MHYQPKISDLVGTYVKQASDMKIQHHRNRYLQAQSIGPSSTFKMVLPRLGAGSLLNLRDIRMMFKLAITSTDAGICVAGPIVHPFQRVKVSCGSTTLLDIDQSALLHTILYLAETDTTNVSDYQKSLTGDGDLATRQGWAATNKQYVIPMFPQETMLRRDGLLNLESLSDMIIEFWTLPATTFLYSPANDTAPSYSMTDIQIMSSYIWSPSIFQFFQSNPIKYSCVDYTYSYQNIQDANSQVRVASSRSSLNSMLMVMRDANVDSKSNVATKLTNWNANGLTTENLLINQQKFFDQDLASFNEFYQELLHLMPEAAHANYFSSAFNSTRFLLGIKFASAPTMFDNEIVSGYQTSALNQEIVLQLQFSAAPSTLQQCNIFLNSDVIIYQSPSTRDLQIKC
jgi:hypothetical protein